MKRSALAAIAGAALSLTAAPSSAAPVSQAAAAVPAAVAQMDGNLIEVRRRGRHYGHWRGHRHGHWRHRRHRHHGIPWFLFAAPFILDGFHHHHHHRHYGYY
jgi:hypothetical protein